MNQRNQILGYASAMLFAASVQASSSIDESRDLVPGGLVQVENLAGSIDITVWDQAGIHIGGDLGDDVEKLEITESSSGIQIRVHNRNNQRHVDESHLRLQVPVTASIEAEGVSADISVSGLESSSLVLNSVSGDLVVDARTELLEAESVSGDVTFRGYSSRASAETVSGDIDLQGIEVEIRISTVSGDAKLSAQGIARGRFETVSGELDLQLDLVEGGRLNAESMSGDVHLVLPAAQQADFTAQTYSGSIRSDFGSVQGSSHGPGKTFSFLAGNNGATIKIESFSGDVRISQH